MALVSMRDVTRERNNEQKLEQSNAEKDALLREVYHRVKNNLSVLESLVRLEEDRIGDSDPVVLLENIRDRIHSIALVHEKLHRGADVARLRFDDYLSELVRHVVASMQVADSDIYPQFDLEPVDFGMNVAVPLGLIVTELVTNAVKYACRGRPDARLFVGLHAEDDGYVLSIQDNGPGLPDGFDPEASHSLGLRLVAGLTKQINGTLSWGSDGGAWFRIAVAERDPNH
jgi:two-component sensor histidine kinase